MDIPIEYYSISMGSYLDTMTKNYINVLIIDREPSGELKKLVTMIPSIQTDNCQCRFAFTKLQDTNSMCYNRSNTNFVTEHDIPALFTKLTSIHYIVDTELTQIMKSISNINSNTNSNKLICYIKSNK